MISLGLDRLGHDATETAIHLAYLRATIPIRAGATAAIETVRGEVSRVFAGAKVTGPPALRRYILAHAGRAAIDRGEVVYLIDVDDGRLQLHPATQWNLERGGPRPTSWTYQIDVAGPSATETRFVRGDAVLHAIFDPDEHQPWRGLGALRRASISEALHGLLEGALAGEARIPVARIIPLPHGTTDPVVQRLRQDLEAGGVALPETTAAGFGDGRISAPLADWKPHRLGPQPEPGAVELARDAALRIAAALGYRPALLDSKAAAAASREAWRQFVVATVQPLADIFTEAASAALEADVTLSFDHLLAGDMQSAAARTVKMLTDAGVPLADARAAAGI